MHTPTTPITTDEWFEKWMELYKKRTVKAGTVDTYTALYKSQIHPAIGHIALASVTQEQLQTLINNQYDQGYASNTIQLTRAVLSGMLGKANSCSIIGGKPSEGLTLPRAAAKKEVHALTKEEQQTLLHYCTGTPIEGPIKLALYTGMRGGEICGIQWQDVDFDANAIHIRHTLKSTKGIRYYLDTPKTSSSIRDIPLVGKARALLDNTPNKSNTFVFQINGDPITKGKLQSELKKIQRSIWTSGAQISEFTFHCLRHTFATRCIEAGMKPKVLQKILGHSSLAITMDTYVTVQEDEKEREMFRVQESL